MKPIGPKLEEFQQVADDFGFELPRYKIQAMLDLSGPAIGAYQAISEIPEPPLPESQATLTKSWRPEAEDNPHNAWYWRCELSGANSGPLAGKTIAIKDAIAVAGVPLMNGSKTYEGTVPDVNATCVERVLGDGGRILGKAACEDMCVSGASHTNAIGPVLNPRSPTHNAGGSSSGCAALVAAGAVDMAIGEDTGGSIRAPSALCGIYGLKPSFGLVPCTGAVPLEPSMDHIGPMANSVADCALLLTSMAGPDGLDPYATLAPDDYLSSLNAGVAGLRIGILKEGFGRPDSEAVVDERVRRAAQAFGAMGATVADTSVPEHDLAQALFISLAFEGLAQQIMRGRGTSPGLARYDSPAMAEAHRRAATERAADLPDTIKLILLLGEHMWRAHDGALYSKSQRLRRSVRAAFDKALTAFDLLLLPTTPSRANLLPASDAPYEEQMNTLLHLGNTCVFDVTGHPAMAVPAGLEDGLPISMMLVGRHGDDATVLRAAASFEAHGDWQEFS